MTDPARAAGSSSPTCRATSRPTSATSSGARRVGGTHRPGRGGGRRRVGQLAVGGVVRRAAAPRARPAGRRALGRRRGADPVLLRGRAGAQARVHRRLAAPAVGCRGAGDGGGLRGGVARRDLPPAQHRPGRRARGLGDPGGDRHRLRAGGARRGRVQPADRAAGVPAHARGRRRPHRHHHHRGVLHRGAVTWPGSRSARWRSGCSRSRSASGSARPLLLVPLALAAWWCTHESGIHATIAGVALGLLVRVRRDEGEERSPCERLEHLLSPVSSGIAVPFFALMSAGVVVTLDGELIRRSRRAGRVLRAPGGQARRGLRRGVAGRPA